MPIIVKDYRWKQTETLIVIYIPLNGIPASKVAIFSTDNYVKAHFSPFLFEVFLHAPVIEIESQCTVAEGEVVFQLHKEKHGLWDDLELKLDKANMVELRRKAVERAQQVAQERSKDNVVKKDQLQKQSVRQQIQLDSDERAYVEGLKQQARSTALKDLQQWKASSAVLSCQTSAGCSRPQGLSTLPAPNRKISCLTECEKKTDSKSHANISFEATEYECAPVPLARHSGKILVNFTPRAFPTPSRESQAEEEQEWLKKQAEARRRVGFVVEDLRPEEHDPVWLKDKGDSDFRAGNYLGAISAYSHAIQLGSKMPELYSNRAAAHLALNNLHKTLDDCTQALNLLVPAVSLNALQRARCYARRGSALCRLGLPAKGLVDLKMALSLRPDNKLLQDDIAKAQALNDSLPSGSDSDEYLT